MSPGATASHRATAIGHHSACQGCQAGGLKSAPSELCHRWGAITSSENGMHTNMNSPWMARKARR